MKKNLCSLLITMSFASYANDRYPLEFADFFTEKKETVEVAIAGEQKTSKIKGLVTYDSFKLIENKDNQRKLRSYLIERGLTEKSIDNIFSTLTQGIAANPGCQSLISVCIPEDKVGTAEYTFDFDKKLLKLFVSSDMLMVKNEKNEYHETIKENKALIVSSDLYFSVNGQGQDYFNLNNNLVWGLPAGHISAETQYSQDNDDLDVYEAVYDVNVKNHRAIVGYQDQNQKALNSTDFLDYGLDLSGYAATLGTSKNLLKGSNSTHQKINFYSPESGQLEVYRGDRVLVSRFVAQGQNVITYDELPYGIYNIVIKVKRGNEDVLTEERNVVNTKDFDLAVGDYDYRAQVGYLEDINNKSARFDDEINDDSRYYGRLSSTTRLNESLLLGGGVSVSQDDTQFQIGANWAFDERLTTQVNSSFFSSGAMNHFASVSYSPFFVSGTYTNTLGAEGDFAALLLDEKESTEWNVGVTGDFFGGTAYLSYYAANEKNETGEFENDSINANWSRDIFKGTLSINSSYMVYGEHQDSWSTNITWSMPLGEDTTSRTGMYFDEEGLEYSQSSVTYSKSYDDVNVSATAGAKIGQNNVESEVSASVNGHSRYLGYSTHGYASDTGERNLSGNLTTTQVISAQGVHSTYKRGKSFIALEPQVEGQLKDDTVMSVNLSKDGSFSYRDNVSVGQNDLIELTPYSDMELELDADSYNVEIENNREKHFVRPGTFFPLNSKVIQLQSQIFVLNDMNGQPVKFVNCIGDGCKDVETLSEDGVFRVNYRNNQPFKLVSEKTLCVYDESLIGQSYIQAYCLGGLEETGSLVNNHGSSNSTENLVYIGKYESVEEVETIVGQISKVGLKTKSIEVGSARYLYVNYTDRYTTAQRSLLESLEAYAILDTINVNELFSVR